MQERQTRSLDTLRTQFADRLITKESVLSHFMCDESFHRGQLPDGLFRPTCTDEVVDFVRACASIGMPLVPFGAGTSLEGHALVTKGGIILDMREMDEIIQVNAEDQDCRCQPGVTRDQLNGFVRDLGLFFPIDPGATATIGGMVATSASGTNAVRYGTMKENVLGLEVVLADGSVIRTASRARKSAAGLDLTRLLIGSEGTLGIITEVALRLRGIPESTKAMSCSFPTLQLAVDAVIVIIQLSILVGRVELLDEVQVAACNKYLNRSEVEEPTLFIEFQGSEAETCDQLSRVREIIDEHGGRSIRSADTQEQRGALWAYRYNSLPAAKALRAGCEVLITDICVPISRLSECIVECRRQIDEAHLVAPIVGHVGDGNFHAFFVINPSDGVEMQILAGVVESMNNLSISMGGTSTGEHGIGIGKKKALIDELGPDTVRAMLRVKLALDPQNILNPGKIFDSVSLCCAD